MLIDVYLPGQDGYSAYRAIRQGWTGHDGRIWFITARSYDNHVDQVREVGAERTIPKPIDPDELVRLIAKAIQRPLPGRAA